jgi:hypothetical protein
MEHGRDGYNNGGDIVRRGCKYIGKLVSVKSGKFATSVLAPSATGNTVPTFFIFPMVNIRVHFLNCAPAGSQGDANPPGWMKAQHFFKFVKHLFYM